MGIDLGDPIHVVLNDQLICHDATINAYSFDENGESDGRIRARIPWGDANLFPAALMPYDDAGHGLGTWHHPCA